MNFREFENKDFDSVQKLVSEARLVPLPSFEELSGYGLVMEEDEVTGFIWALTDDQSIYATIEYFVVKPSSRSKLTSAIFMTQMLLNLLRMGKERIIGIVKKGTESSESLARLYHMAGMDVSEAYVLTGSAKNLVNSMKKQFRIKEH